MIVVAAIAALGSSQIEPAGLDRFKDEQWTVAGKVGDCSTKSDKIRNDPCRKAQLFCEAKGLDAFISFGVNEHRKAPGRMVVTFKCGGPETRRY